MGFRPDYREAADRVEPGGTGSAGAVNAPLTISVLTSLTKAYRPLRGSVGVVAGGPLDIRTTY